MPSLELFSPEDVVVGLIAMILRPTHLFQNGYGFALCSLEFTFDTLHAKSDRRLVLECGLLSRAFREIEFSAGSRASRHCRMKI
jgi:hypothetical protein